MTVHEPVEQFRVGPVICTLWESETRVNGKQRIVLRASIERRYKHQSGGWESSGSLLLKDEIPLAVHCLEKAHEAIVSKDDEMKENGKTFY